MPIQDRLSEIQDAIGTYAGGRSVTLVAVSKYADISQMVAAYEAGVRHFGENKVQDATAKMAQFPTEYRNDLHWHLIGTLQSNKAKKTLGCFDLIHSIDSVRLAGKISDHNLAAGLVQPVLLQVNLSEDPTRHGFFADVLRVDLKEILSMKGIVVRGLMGMAPPEVSASGDSDALKQVFCGMAALRDDLARDYAIALPELSMGMSQDYTHALACGATIVRLGNYLFKN